MKTKKILSAILFIFLALLMVQCEKYGDRGGMPEPDEDSDRPEWAGGNTDANEHNKKGDSGGNPGVEYGDQIMLHRDVNGVPILDYLGYTDDEGEWVESWIARPVAEDGTLLDIYEDGETAGELIDPEAAVEIDFGRLNIVKSPPSVLNQAFNEALTVLTKPGAEITLDFCGRLNISWRVDGIYFVKTIDSPRENMAIYKYLMQNLFEGEDNELAFLGTDYGFNPLDIAASCFAAGSDKTGFVDIDEVVYINGMIDCYGLAPIDNCCDYITYDVGYNLDAEELNRDGTVRQYFDFGQSGKEGGAVYKYNRDVYKTRGISIVILNPNGTWGMETVSVWQAMEDRGLFSFIWEGPDLTHVKGFAAAVDDAVQVLEFIHGDSNITFLPDWVP